MKEIYHECQHCGRTVYVEDVEGDEQTEGSSFKRVYDEDCGCEAERLRAEEQAHYEDMMNND